MLLNPELAKMTQEDLNQRYHNSYVRYNNQVLFCHTFDSRKKFTVSRKDELLRGVEFDWRLLDCTRPRPHWFKVDAGPLYISYWMERQYSRGFNPENCRIWSPVDGSLAMPSSLALAALTGFFAPIEQKRTTLTKVLEDVEKFQRGVVVSPQLCVQRDAVWYREKCIGTLRKVHPLFLMELKDIIEDYDENDVRLAGYPEGPVAAKVRKVPDLLRVARRVAAPRQQPVGRAEIDWNAAVDRVRQARQEEVAGRDQLGFNWNEAERLLAEQNP